MRCTKPTGKHLLGKKGFRYLDPYLDSKTKIKMMCPSGHIIQKTPDSLSYSGCSICYKESKRKKYKPEDVCVNGVSAVSSGPFTRQEVVEFRCANGHTFTKKLLEFFRSPRCPVCSQEEKRKSIDKIMGAISSEGYTAAAIRYKDCNSKLSVTCNKGHEYTTAWRHWQQGSRCPTCHDQRSWPKHIEKLEKLGYTVLSSYVSRSEKLDLVCPQGHCFKANKDSFLSNPSCPKCRHTGPEREIADFLKSMMVTYTEYKKMFGFELDFFVPHHNLAIEVCGFYWHSTKFRNKYYHYNKWKVCKENGIRLLTAFEDELDQCKEEIASVVYGDLNPKGVETAVVNNQWSDGSEYLKSGYYVVEELEPKSFCYRGNKRVKYSENLVYDCGHTIMKRALL